MKKLIHVGYVSEGRVIDQTLLGTPLDEAIKEN